MKHLVNRRQFLAAAAAASAASVLEGLSGRALASPAPGAGQVPALAVVKGANAYDAVVKAVEMLGGMKTFVPPGARVGLLVNSRFDKPGTYVKPQIALAVAVLCLEAGAREIVSLEDVSRSYWRRAVLSPAHEKLVRDIKEPAGGVSVPVKGGRRLTEIEITRDYLDCDVIINVPVFKDHAGTHFTGNLKNIMGATRGGTNRHWHLGSGAAGYYEDPGFLSECIAEANLVRRPTLSVADGTEMIITNGPFGPGKILRPQTVVAGKPAGNICSLICFWEIS